MTYYYVFMYLFICHYLLLKKVSVLWGGAAGKLLIADSRESHWILSQSEAVYWRETSSEMTWGQKLIYLHSYLPAWLQQRSAERPPLSVFMSRYCNVACRLELDGKCTSPHGDITERKGKKKRWDCSLRWVLNADIWLKFKDRETQAAG